MKMLTEAEPGFQPLFADGHEPAAFEARFPEPGGARPFAALWADAAARHGPATAPRAAEEILDTARRQAEQIIAEACEQAVTAAQAQIAEAVEAVRREHVAAFEEASGHLLEALREEWQAHLLTLERETAGLVADLARRVLHERFEADEEAIVPVVREALRGVGEGDRVQVIVAPQHQAALHEAYQELARVLKPEARLEIVISDTAAPFGCVAHAESGSVDARLDNRLHSLQQAVEETLISHDAA